MISCDACGASKTDPCGYAGSKPRLCAKNTYIPNRDEFWCVVQVFNGYEIQNKDGETLFNGYLKPIPADELSGMADLKMVCRILNGGRI